MIGQIIISQAKCEESRTEFNFFCRELENFSAHELTVFREKYFAFRKDFSQWKLGFTTSFSFTDSPRIFPQVCKIRGVLLSKFE